MIFVHLKKVFKITGILLGSLILLILLLYGVLHLSYVQTRLARYVANDLSKKLNTRVEIDKVDISFFDEVELSKLLIYEQGYSKTDTLAFLGKVKLSVNDYF